MTGYPALVDRALRLVEQRGGKADEAELCRELFGQSGGPWPKMLGQVLGADGRLSRAGDGTWRNGAARVVAEATTSFVAESVGLVVFAAGPKPWKHPIVAIGAARADARFETLVRPEQPWRVPKYLEKLGVRADELDEAPTLHEALERLVDFVGDARLVGLDIGIAVARLQFAQRSVGRAPLDNVTSELAVGEGVKPDLTALARAQGIPVPRRVSAGVLAELVMKLDQGSAVRVDGSALGSTAWRRLLDARVLASIPEAPGVYLFRDRAGKLLYVGKATSLRARLASYLTGQFALVRSMPGLVEATERLEHEELSCELLARAREAELIAEHRPTYNVQRRADPALAWGLLTLDGAPSADGATVPRLRLRLADEPFDGAVLSTVAAARAAFRRLRAGWWPPRPRRDARPTAQQVEERLDGVAAEFAAGVRALPVAPGVVGADLARGLRVEAPVRPFRMAGSAEASNEAWTRERYDRDWPPRELLAWAEDDASGALARAVPCPDGPSRRPGRPPDALDPPSIEEDEAEGSIVLNMGPERLAALSVVLSALRRGEAGVRVMPA